MFNKDNPKIRIIGLVRNEISNQFKCRLDLMSVQFPSIWLEYSDHNNKNQTLISGFYREWSHEGFENDEAQCIGINVFTRQMEKASSTSDRMVLLVLLLHSL